MFNQEWVAVIEDSFPMRQLVLDILQSRNHRCFGFETGESFLTYYHRSLDRTASNSQILPSLILLDVNLPGISGLDLLNQPYAISEKIPVAMLSGESEVAIVVKAMQHGAFDYLLKPIQPEKLLSVVQTGLQRANQQQNDQGRMQQVSKLLSEREMEVLAHLMMGKMSKQIAGDLGLSTRTVENHRNRILKKLNFPSTARLIIYLNGQDE